MSENASSGNLAGGETMPGEPHWCGISKQTAVTPREERRRGFKAVHFQKHGSQKTQFGGAPDSDPIRERMPLGPKSGKWAGGKVGRGSQAEFIERMCGSKNRYPDKRAAISQINVFRRKRGRHGRPESLRAYACPFCHGWHLTKK